MNEITTFIHQDTASIVKRLGLIQFRIAMIFSILRHYEENKEEKKINCSDVDFKSAQLLSDVYLNHALTMFFELPRESKLAINKKIKTFFDALPENTVFKRNDAVNIGRKHQILFNIRNDIVHDRIISYSDNRASKRYNNKLVDPVFGFLVISHPLFPLRNMDV